MRRLLYYNLTWIRPNLVSQKFLKHVLIKRQIKYALIHAMEQLDFIDIIQIIYYIFGFVIILTALYYCVLFALVI